MPQYDDAYSYVVLSNTQPTLEVQFMKKLRNTVSKLKKNVFLIKHKRVRQKTKTLKCWKSTETVLSFGIANEHNCLKIQFSVCVDKFEQYLDTFHLITMNDLQNFVNNSKSVHPFEK